MPLPPTLFCGTSGWSYPHWEGVVYPKAKNRGFHALEHLSRYLDAVEINASFYQSIRPEIAELWIKKVAHNPRFLFCAKLHRRFTHDRIVQAAEADAFKEGVRPLLRARKLGCLLLQFPWTFRFTEENRDFLIHLRRTFHEFPLVAEMRHASWTRDEALGTLIDYHVGFCNIDQAQFTKAMPPTSHVTSGIGYVRLHGRNPQDWDTEFHRNVKAVARHDYLYRPEELLEWRERIDNIRPFTAKTFVFTNNDVAGKSFVNALQMSRILGDERQRAPLDLVHRYRVALEGFRANAALQSALFDRAVA